MECVCPDTYWSNEADNFLCNACNAELCLNCTALDVCTSCPVPEDALLSAKTGASCDACPTTSFAVEATCVKCHETCTTCSTAAADGCESCEV